MMKQRVLLVDDGLGYGAASGGGLLSRYGHHSMAGGFPLLAISLGVYALLNMMSGPQNPWYLKVALNIQHMSGDVWHIRGGDVFLTFSMVLLFVEIVRSTRTSGESILNHALSVIVFIAAILLFFTRPGYGNSTFFLFTSMTLLDFVAGFIITTMAARRDTLIEPAL